MASVYMVVHQLEKDALNSCVITVANITVNLLAGLHGVEYMNTVPGASDTMEFLRFFGEAGSAANIETARLDFNPAEERDALSSLGSNK